MIYINLGSVVTAAILHSEEQEIKTKGQITSAQTLVSHFNIFANGSILCNIGISNIYNPFSIRWDL